MTVVQDGKSDLVGTLTDGAVRVAVRVVEPLAHTLLVDTAADVSLPDGSSWEQLTLAVEGREIVLGRSRFDAHAAHPLRRSSDPLVPMGKGRLVFLDTVYDFSSLARKGCVVDLEQRMSQLDLMWRRKASIAPPFRDYVAEMVYDLQVYRSVLDEIDSHLGSEPKPSADTVLAVATTSEYPRFCRIFDAQLARLETLVADFSKEEHERHGYYLRKHVWDLILASEFLARTNLKPRGYAGDSAMMHMVYDRDFRGQTLFARFLHRHPIETHAAQAVRNRIGLLSGLLTARHEAEASRLRGEPLRIMSVACGPARELRDVITTAAQARAFSITLLDQDTQALQEAQSELAGITARVGVPIAGRVLQESVRTMLRTPELDRLWGRFDFLYSMGLFDYLTPPVARAVLMRLYSLLEPGGEMVIGNFHVGNRTRFYMEYWMDWVLFYRTEDEFLDLASDLVGAQCSIIFEETRSQMFLRVRKAT